MKLNHCLPLKDWPQSDRELWLKVIAPRRGPFGATRQRPITLGSYRKSYGSWVSYLDEIDQLDFNAGPADRPTAQRSDGYLQHLIDCGNAGLTILRRFEHLRRVLQMMVPEIDFHWITNPNGVPLSRLLDLETDQKFVPDASVALAWAQELFQEAVAMSSRYYRCLGVRDATIIGILLCPAPRVRALASLRIGRHLKCDAGRWILIQDRSITKMRNHIELPILPEAGAMLDRYLAVERLELLSGRQPHDFLWVTHHGRKMHERSIQACVFARTAERFGVGFGPQRFRTMLATKQAQDNGDAPFDAWQILEILPRSPSGTTTGQRPCGRAASITRCCND